MTTLFQHVVSRVFPAALVLLMILPASARVTLQMENGMSVSADLLKETEAAYLVDLGFEVLRIPREAVTSVTAEDAAAAAKQGIPKGLLFEEATNGSDQSVQDLVKKLGEAVVEIRTPTGLGSGFVIHPDGYIITNHHVIAGENKLTVTVFRGEKKDLQKLQYRKVRLVALHPHRDLALLKIEGAEDEKFEHVVFGDSDSLREGQTLFAIGSPLGLDRTVSKGVVSLANRVMNGRLFVQTTTQINPGNSGGPLFNLKGQVVGVNVLKASQVGVEGLGFSIPVNQAKYFISKRDAFAFDPRNPNAGFRYMAPPKKIKQVTPTEKVSDDEQADS